MQKPAETDRYETRLYAETERESPEADSGGRHNKDEPNQRGKRKKEREEQKRKKKNIYIYKIITNNSKGSVRISTEVQKENL